MRANGCKTLHPFLLLDTYMYATSLDMPSFDTLCKLAYVKNASTEPVDYTTDGLNYPKTRKAISSSVISFVISSPISGKIASFTV